MDITTTPKLSSLYGALEGETGTKATLIRILFEYLNPVIRDMTMKAFETLKPISVRDAIDATLKN